MKMRRARPRKKLISSSQVEVWAAGVSSGPSYEAFTMPTPRGLSTIGTPVDSSLAGRKRPASDAEQSHDSASFGTLLQHVVVERGDTKDAAFACHQHPPVGGVGSAGPSQQPSSHGVKQIVLKLSGLRRCPATSGESSVKYGEPVTNTGTEAESTHETMWSTAAGCTENRQNDHVMNTTRPDLQSSCQGSPVKVLHPAPQIPGSKEECAAQKENKLRSAGCGDDSGGCVGNVDKSCCVLATSKVQANSGIGQDLPTESFPHPSNPSWSLNANVCRSCCVPPSLNNQSINPCNVCTATRFPTFQQGVSRAVHYISGEDVMVCPAPWVHEGRDESYQMPDPVYPPGHCNGFGDDLDMETQRHLEEQIAQEILLLSQKLANLQARYGARRPVHNNTKPAVLSCPLTPLLLDITRRDVKSNPRAPNSSRITHRQQPESRSQPEEKKLGAGRNGGTNTKAAASTPAQSSNRGSDSGVQTTCSKSFPLSRAVSVQGSHLSGNSAPGSRSSAAHNGCQALGASEPTPTAPGGVEVGKSSKNSRTFASPHRKRRDRQAEEHMDECSHSDDMKDLLKTPGGSHVQGYPNGSKRFDWVKTLRIATGVHETQGCADFAQDKASSPHHREGNVCECFVPSSVSKSVQTGASTEDCYSNDAKTSGILQVLDSRTRTGKPQTVNISHSALLHIKSRPSEELGGSQLSESVGEDGVYDSRTSSFFPTAMKATGDSESRLKRRPDSSSIENRPGKSGKRTVSPEEMRGLDSRIHYHVLKGGLRRTPSLRNALRVKKKTFGSRSPRKDGGKRLRTRTLLDLNLKAYSSAAAKVAPREEKVSPRSCEEGVDVQWPSEAAVADCEAEYETFVESTDAVGCEEEETCCREGVLPREAEGSQKPRSGSPSGISTAEANAKPSEAPVLSLMKTPQAPRKTFIRCIDLVVATKKKNQITKLNGSKASGVRYSYRRVDCSKSPLISDYELDECCLMEPQTSEVFADVVTEEPPLPSKPSLDDSSEPDPSTTMDAQDALEQPSKPASQDPSELTNKADGENLDPSLSSSAAAAVALQVSNLASVLSRVIPKQMESMDAAQLRARWAELIDALEEERLGLPKIKTSSSSSSRKVVLGTSTGSPRDSGGVKRIAEQMKSAYRGTAQNDKEGVVRVAPEEGARTRARPLWSKVEQKQEVVF